MPHIDGRTGEVVIRIVYDGAPEAGKTTNVERLKKEISLQRRGASKSPGTTGERTEFFDWLDFAGGYLDGRRVRCQLVTVPGQASILHRRRYLLESADAIVFVVDARPGGVESAVANVETTLRIASRSAGEVPVGLIVQANKQDLPDALPPSAVREALKVPETTPAIAAVACEGTGLMDTFVIAVRLASDRVRSLVQRGEIAFLEAKDESPDALHQAMREKEPVAITEREPSPPEPATPVVDVPLTATVARRPNAAAAPDFEVRCRLSATDFASGHIWPPVKGRAAFAAATDEWLAEPHVRDWAPEDAFEWSTADWVIHSTAEWTYGDEWTARAELLAKVRRIVTRVELAPDHRALAIAKEGERWRLWLLTQNLRSMKHEALVRASNADVADLTSMVADYAQAILRLRETGHLEPALRAGLDGLALQGGRLVVLALHPADEGESARPGEALINVLRPLMSGQALSNWFAFEAAPRLASLDR